ncbi:DUF2789 domain-containing protein [Catenovulum sediminis]|uniref:DUF2789 domain-containing protein n=1 Tax=Catenovulum sediminis TaxID=1740262 RepID=UPI00117E0911|nr:DUF2789 domain-containing protein [Catenovulum sediminis]
METEFHTLGNLFEQLGIADNEQAIDAFIDKHKPLPNNIQLHQASFWSAGQKSFLHEAIAADADWAEVVDQLDAMLRD